jgi:hypothetical protein
MTKAERSKNMRYKKPALAMLSREGVFDELYDISSKCSDLQYYMSDDDTLLNALDGDEEDEYEFRMLFGDLSAKCDFLNEAMADNYVTEHLDDFLVGCLGGRYCVIGYDGYEEDYFGLTRFESGLAQTESGKRLMRLTKEQLLSVAGQVMGIVISFLDVRQKYDYLRATFDILKDQNTSILDNIKAIEEAYEKAANENFYDGQPNTRLFNTLLSNLPDRAWLE